MSSSTSDNEELVEDTPLVHMSQVELQKIEIEADTNSNGTSDNPVYPVSPIYGDILDDEEYNLQEEVVASDEKYPTTNEDTVIHFDSDETTELIVPDIIEPYPSGNTKHQKYVEENVKYPESKQSCPDSWPILEILPGGVIKYTDKDEGNQSNLSSSSDDGCEKKLDLYSCAKCSESFKYIFCLVEHVRVHEKEEKYKRIAKSNQLLDELNVLKDHGYISLSGNKRKLVTEMTRKTKKIPKS